jgi:hypothetical protein
MEKLWRIWLKKMQMFRIMGFMRMQFFRMMGMRKLQFYHMQRGIWIMQLHGNQ